MSKTKTQEQCIENFIKVHGNKYDYSKVKYVNSKTKVCIICTEHGEFWQTPSNHLNGNGCKQCGIIKVNKYNTKDNDYFIKKAKIIHGDEYDYSKVEYKKSREKVCIICPIHGEFWQTPNDHLCGCGCVECSYEKRKNEKRDTYLDFEERGNKIHNGQYLYYHDYINSHTLVKIQCLRCGLIFKQLPCNHLQGKGCPQCRISKIEDEVRNILQKNNIKYVYQASKKDLKWIGLQSLDFYLPQYNVAIECQGIQHFETVKHFGGEKGLSDHIERDSKKIKLCQENGIKLLYYANYKYNFPYDVITDKDKLLYEIKCLNLK